MAFSWVEDISEGSALITKAVVDEIRTNVDYVKDNEACVSDKVTYNASQDTIDDGDHDTTHHTDENTGVQGTHNAGYDVDQHSTYRNDHNSGVDSNDKVTYYNDDNQSEDAPHDSYVHDTYKSNVLTMDNSAQWANNYSLNKASNKVGVYYTQDSAEYTDFYSPYNAEVYNDFHSGYYMDDHYAY